MTMKNKIEKGIYKYGISINSYDSCKKKVNDYLKLPEQDYYLGSVAPDLAKYVGKTKKISHMIDNPEYKDLPNIYRFIEKYKTELNKPFEMGYLVHLLTDKIWYERFLINFILKIILKLWMVN